MCPCCLEGDLVLEADAKSPPPYKTKSRLPRVFTGYHRSAVPESSLNATIWDCSLPEPAGHHPRGWYLSSHGYSLKHGPGLREFGAALLKATLEEEESPCNSCQGLAWQDLPQILIRMSCSDQLDKLSGLVFTWLFLCWCLTYPSMIHTHVFIDVSLEL